MASCSNFAKPAAGSDVYGQTHKWLRCVVILFILSIMLKGACAKTVLYNKSAGRHLVVIVPHSMRIDMPVGQSIELEGAQQQRGVMIQDVESGGVTGPLDLPDNRSLEVVWLDSFTPAEVGVLLSSKGNVCVGNVLQASINHGGNCH